MPPLSTFHLLHLATPLLLELHVCSSCGSSSWPHIYTHIRVQGPDRKTVERLLARMIDSGKAKRTTISIPGSYQSGEARTVRGKRERGGGGPAVHGQRSEGNHEQA